MPLDYWKHHLVKRFNHSVELLWLAAAGCVRIGIEIEIGIEIGIEIDSWMGDTTTTATTTTPIAKGMC